MLTLAYVSLLFSAIAGGFFLLAHVTPSWPPSSARPSPVMGYICAFLFTVSFVCFIGGVLQ